MKKLSLVYYCVLIVFSQTLFSCDSLNITSYTTSGAPGSIVVVEGDVSWARVIWDATSPEPRELKSGFLGANFFTVPYDASEGVHKFQIIRNNEQSEVFTFTVTAERPKALSYIQEITPIWTLFRGNKVITWLMIQGPNIDAGATIYVDGRRAPTLSYKVMINDLYGIDPATLGIPKYHYTALLVMIPSRDVGSTVLLKLVNLDGHVPNSDHYYKLPASAATLDSDGDNIPDAWETGGYDANGDGTIDLDLRALGADPYRKDVFLELDIMENLSFPPEEEVFDVVKSAFAAAPIISGRAAANGVNLYINHEGRVPYADMIYHLCCVDGVVDLYEFKRNHFNNNLLGRIFQYGVWGHAMAGGASGVSDPQPSSSGRFYTIPGDELAVTMDDFPQSFQTTRNRASTLMHEIGHNLSQTHGGLNMFPNNPAYNSVMSYNWQLRTGLTNTFRIYKRCCMAFFYAQAGAREIDGNVFATNGTVIDFSEGMGRQFYELELDEHEGICDHIPVDWNYNGVIDDQLVEYDVDQTRRRSGEEEDIFGDFCNWCELDFRGPQLNGSRDF